MLLLVLNTACPLKAHYFPVLHAAIVEENTERFGAPVQVPTTLMAAIDASIGIKTAVNFDNRKNKLGTYCPPLGVFIDRSALFLLRCVCLHLSIVWK